MCYSCELHSYTTFTSLAELQLKSAGPLETSFAHTRSQMFKLAPKLNHHNTTAICMKRKMKNYNKQKILLISVKDDDTSFFFSCPSFGFVRMRILSVILSQEKHGACVFPNKTLRVSVSKRAWRKLRNAELNNFCIKFSFGHCPPSKNYKIRTFPKSDTASTSGRKKKGRGSRLVQAWGPNTRVSLTFFYAVTETKSSFRNVTILRLSYDG
jgi:hypothetical protein